MKKSRILLLAAALTAGVSAPALAAYDKIATIDVGAHPDRDSGSPDFGGPVERLQFIARGSDVDCQYIRATYSNGRTDNVFSGRLRQGAARSVDLPGAQRDIRRLTTNCRSTERRGASIDLYADVGSYRSTWQRSPNWARTWAALFNWGPSQPSNGGGYNGGGYGNQNPSSMSGWNEMTTVRFDGRNDREGDATGLAGYNVDKIALRAIDTDARCSRVIAVFGGGDRIDYASQIGVLRAGQNQSFSLPGGGNGATHHVTRINMMCHALNGRAVTIKVIGRQN